MALIFGNDKHARGCYTEMMLRVSGASSGVYLDLAGMKMPAADETTPYLVTSLGFAQKEKYNIVQCFGERNYTYAFGHDPAASTMEITMTAFLASEKGTVFGDSLLGVLKAYEAARLSRHKKYVIMTLGKTTMQGFLVGLTGATQDQEHNTQSVTFAVLLVEPQKGN